MATVSKVDSNKLRLQVKNEIGLISAKYGADLANVSKSSYCIT